MIAVGMGKVYLACGATDLRKSIDGLAALVQESFSLDPFDGAMFVFCNRGHDRIKILEWDGDGFWLHMKRLERGRFGWPDANGGKTMHLTQKELEMLIGGARLLSKLKRRDMFSAEPGRTGAEAQERTA
jgi:transposase